MTLKIPRNRGFTLLLSIVVTSMLLLVSFVVVNVALKQLVIANANEESQYAFYNADSGVECATYWDIKASSTSAFTASGNHISCRAQDIVISGGPVYSFTWNLPKGCAVVQVDKSVSGATRVDSRGYNTCDTSAARRFERGVTLSY